MADRCNMPTGNGFRFCTRKARVFYLRAPGDVSPDGLQVAGYCKQHADGGGKAALLRPLPWEYDYIYDRATGAVDYPRIARRTEGAE